MSTIATLADTAPKAKGTGLLRQLALPLGAISTVFVMLVPLPAVLMDVLLALSITASVIVFLTAIQVRKATELSVFPTLLLLLTLFRLSLNLASSRRILLHGSEGTHAAGSVIEAFGQFVVGGNYVVGFVLFLALIAIQFLVVSHGAVRTAEVTARFTLDALPGKQMAIDADMNAGLIDEQGARKRREAIAREAEFYGAMDGAARFNQRDSLATILITAINIVAGLLIGVLQQGVDLMTAVKTYTILTVGDGLVTMIPSLLVSIAGGLVLTRASSAGTLDEELGQQLFARRNTLYMAAGVLAALALVPGLPKLAFWASHSVSSSSRASSRSRPPATPTSRSTANPLRPQAPTHPAQRTLQASSRSTTSRSKSASSSFRWSTKNRAARCSTASAHCAAISPPSSASSSPPSTSPTTSAFAHASTSSRSGASRSAAGRPRATACSPSTPIPARARSPASRLASPPSTYRPAGSSPALKIRRSPPATPSSTRLLSSAPTSPNSSVVTRTSCLAAQRPSGCSTA